MTDKWKLVSREACRRVWGALNDMEILSPASRDGASSESRIRACTIPENGALMINGAHVVIYSKNPEADRSFFRDVLKFPFADAGHEWLIFALPAAESAFHPAETNEKHELYLMCDDLKGEITNLRAKDVTCSEVVEARWGLITKIRLPGGGEIGLHQPKHPRP